MQAYKTPAGRAEATIVEKKSEFIALLAPAENEAEALEVLQQQRAAHRTANHNVYAYVLQENQRTRYSDDGEPAKTAGLPVLTVLQHSGLSNCIIVVTRYFGGTLLGTGGLVRAYSSAASAAIAAATVATFRPVTTILLSLAYPYYEQVMRILDEAGAASHAEFGGQVNITSSLPAEEIEAPLLRLKELLRGDEGIQIQPTALIPWPPAK